MSGDYTSGSEKSREILVWKKRGETLAAMLRRVRQEEGIDEEVPLTYAGRLDPMAEGQVLVLAGEARFHKEERLARSKTYRFEILLGVATDTYDVLGIPTAVSLPLAAVPSDEAVREALCALGTERLPYPPYSSKPVGGVPLFVYARSGATVPRLPLQNAPAGAITLIKRYERPCGELVREIVQDVGKVEGDFRQRDIQEVWQRVTDTAGSAQAVLLVCEATVPAGVYIRSVAHTLGERLGTGALAYTIARTSLGL